MAGETVQDQVEHPELNPQNKRYKTCFGDNMSEEEELTLGDTFS